VGRSCAYFGPLGLQIHLRRPLPLFNSVKGTLQREIHHVNTRKVPGFAGCYEGSASIRLLEFQVLRHICTSNLELADDRLHRRAVSKMLEDMVARDFPLQDCQVGSGSRLSVYFQGHLISVVWLECCNLSSREQY
jgi:hypothetical protein